MDAASLAAERLVDATTEAEETATAAAGKPPAWPFDDDDDRIPSVQHDTIALLQSIGKNFAEIGRNDNWYSPMCNGDKCYINKVQRLLGIICRGGKDLPLW